MSAVVETAGSRRPPPTRVPGRTRSRAVIRLARLAVTAFVSAFVVGITAALLIPLVLGGRTLVVMSGSMEPALGVGDAVAVRSVSARALRIGDVITFRSPDGAARLLTHRVRRITIANGRVRIVTKGDSNTGAERWSTAASGTVGRVEYRIPKVGYVLTFARTGLGRIALMTVPALVLGVLALVRIWRRDVDASPPEADA